MQKSTWFGLVVVIVIVGVVFWVRRDTYPQFAQKQLSQPITAIEFQPYSSETQTVPMVRIEEPEVLQRLSEWLKTLPKAEMFAGGNDPICPLILYMEDGTTRHMKISPTMLKFGGIKISDPINTITISWQGYYRSGDNIFEEFLNHYNFNQPSTKDQYKEMERTRKVPMGRN